MGLVTMSPLTLFEYALAIAGGVVVIRGTWFVLDVILGGLVAVATDKDEAK